jgi:hypothetical protein
MTERVSPAVLAEDLRALVEVVPFDDPTIAMLEQAADLLEQADWSAIAGDQS